MSMNARWITLAILLALPASLHAGVLSPINLNQQADVNHKRVDTPTVPMSTVPASRVRAATVTGTPRATESKRRATLKGGRLTYSARTYPTHSTGTVPVTNFSAKRLPTSDQVTAPPIRATQSAPIKDRVIRANTGRGETELKDQLKVLP